MKTDWHGFEAWQLENDRVRVLIVPVLGAKIASIVDKVADHEWLAPPTNPVRERIYGDTFTDHDLGGWDEMFPTISACLSPHDASIELPDHGEVWSMPWQTLAQSDTHQTLHIRGRSLDYDLTRSMTLLENGFRLNYTLENRTDRSMPFLWAGHPLFKGTPDTKIGLPAGVESVINVADHPRLGKPDTKLAWYEAQLADGGLIALNQVGMPTLRDYRKFYTPPEQAIDTAWLSQTDIGRAIHLIWDAQVAPYLGVWVDEGTYTRTTTIALEPATGYYDALSLAQANERITTLDAHASCQWWLEAHLVSQSE